MKNILILIGIGLLTGLHEANALTAENPPPTSTIELPGQTKSIAQPIASSTLDRFMKREAAPHVLVDKDHYVWGLSVLKWSDGKYHAYYARWPYAKGFDAWMTDCEIAHAVADHPEGPFVTTGTVLSSRNANGWDLVNAHNPSVCVADGKIYLYYISNNLKGRFTPVAASPFPTDQWMKEKRSEIVRNSQCIGVAMADQPEGPFVRSEHVVVEPHGQFKNIAVNPAVIYRNGRFVMVAKGDDVAKDNWFRIQLAGHSNQPDGPFKFVEEPVYKEAMTEDACLWFDDVRKEYNMVCHVIGRRDLAHFVSSNSLSWTPAPEPVFMKKQIQLDNGSTWKPGRVERPFVLADENGQPIMLYVAIKHNGTTGNIAIPLTKETP